MYSLVLAAALTSSVSAPERGFFWGWGGYYGPRPVVVAPVAYAPYGAWYGYYPWAGTYPPYWGTTTGWFAPPYPAYPAYGWPAPPAYAWTAPVVPPAQHVVGSEESADAATLPPARAVGDAREQAAVVVQAPLDVVLKFNGVRVERSAERETLTTPALEPGRPFHYKVAAFAVRDGKRVRDDRVVVVRAGKQTVVDFSGMGPGTDD